MNAKKHTYVVRALFSIIGMLTFPAIELLALIIGVVLLALLILICIIVFATISSGRGLRGAMSLLKENIFGPGNNANNADKHDPTSSKS